MAKLFYTLSETASKLGKTEDEVQQMAANGQLQEFRDRDRRMFKVEQVDLLAGGDEDEVMIPLAADNESSGTGSIKLASDSDTGMNLESPKEQTGISIFDADSTEDADPSAVTHVSAGGPDIQLDSGGSGSGLLDLTREADDTSLGGNLLADVERSAGETKADSMSDSGPSQLFEPTGVEEATAGAGSASALIAAMAEPFDGGWSGFTGGLAFGMVLVLGLTLTLTIFGLTGNTSGGLIAMISQNLPMWLGIAAGVVLLPGLIGMFVGKRD